MMVRRTHARRIAVAAFGAAAALVAPIAKLVTAPVTALVMAWVAASVAMSVTGSAASATASAAASAMSSVAATEPGADGKQPVLPQASDPTFRQAEETIARVLALKPNTRRARNVILFVGDGNGVSTVTATRIFEGQQRGADGESNVLPYEAFPYLAASKTYSTDAQVSDSAPTATAMVSGVKTRNDILGLDGGARRASCADQRSRAATTIFELAEQAGMATGIVTNTRITHATPAAAYAHAADRDWESDADLTDEAREGGCLDIARQLVEMRHGDGLEVALGGGRRAFLPEGVRDPEDGSLRGRRKDGRDLTRAWLERYGSRGAYVWSEARLDRVDPAQVDHLLGLFDHGHMEYDVDRAKDAAGEPSLAAMTTKAIDILARNPQGFVLMVEGGRIDHASHASNAYRTLTEGVAMADAVKAALAKVSLDETLVIVTADHSHTLTIGGYPRRGNPILGVVVETNGRTDRAKDGRPYTTLAFANGPGGPVPPAPRPRVTMEQATDPEYVQQSAVPLDWESHAGEDVAIYAAGPWAHLFQGTVEQNYIFHVMYHATEMAERMAAGPDRPPGGSAE